jgi:hypothetical protein
LDHARILRPFSAHAAALPLGSHHCLRLSGAAATSGRFYSQLQKGAWRIEPFFKVISSKVFAIGLFYAISKKGREVLQTLQTPPMLVEMTILSIVLAGFTHPRSCMLHKDDLPFNSSFPGMSLPESIV